MEGVVPRRFANSTPQVNPKLGNQCMTLGPQPISGASQTSLTGQGVRTKIPAGDSSSSRGQRPRNRSYPPTPTLQGSHRAALPVCRASPRALLRPFQGRVDSGRGFRGRCPRLLNWALSGHRGLRARPFYPAKSMGNNQYLDQYALSTD